MVASRRLAPALGLLIGACASLPDVQEQIASAPDSPLSVVDAGGRASSQRAQALVEQLASESGARAVLERHLAFEQVANPRQPLVLGNRVELLQNGPQTYEAMFAAIRAAKDHVHLETYLFDDDEVGREFASVLGARAAEGLSVRVIHDGVGTAFTPRAFFDSLRARGVQTVEFNPVNPLSARARPLRVNHRDHRKLLIVDGRIAFVGGINISDSYSSSPTGGRRKPSASGADERPGWRDTHLRIEGPVVPHFQRLFVDTWQRQNGPAIDATRLFPEVPARGHAAVRAIAHVADEPGNPIYSTLLSAIGHSEYQVHLTIAYFAPDPQLIDALRDAAQRGVDVALILPSRTDSWAIFHVGRSHYQALLDQGVRIYERRGTVMHSKTASIDGVWSTIGSTNLDWRSFVHNDEVNAVVLDPDFARHMDTMFQADLRASDAVDPVQWRQRSLWLRMQEATARLGEYLL